MKQPKKKSPSKTSKAVGLKYGFRSGLEERISKELEGTGCCFTYEQEVIHYEKPARNSKYTPDFVIQKRPDGTEKERPLVIESKGRFLTADRQKHLLVKNQHPNVDIRFVFSNSRQRISKQSKTTYAMWCEKHGYKYADGSVPDEWLWEWTYV